MCPAGVFTQFFGQCVTVIFSTIRNEDGEFLAPEPEGRAAIAERIEDDLSDMLDHHVSRIMTKHVVETLEVVDIDHQAGEAVFRRGFSIVLEPLIEEPTVIEPAQRIPFSEVCQRVAQLQVGDGKPDILGNQFKIKLCTGIGGWPVLWPFQIEKPDHVAHCRQRDAQGLRFFVVEVLAGNICGRDTAHMWATATQGPAGIRGKRGI